MYRERTCSFIQFGYAIGCEPLRESFRRNDGWVEVVWHDAIV